MNYGVVATAGVKYPDLLQDLVTDLHFEMRELADTTDGPLAGENIPDCLLVDWRTESGRRICRAIRRDAHLADLPIVALVEDPWSPQVADAFTAGSDDFLPAEHLAAARLKIIAVRNGGVPTGEYLSGKVVIADPDPGTRVIFGRHLRKMGLEVVFAAEIGDIPYDTSVKLVVANGALGPEHVREAIAKHRALAGVSVPWIVTGASDDDLANAGKILAAEPRLSFFDTDGDTAQIVFAANKMLVGNGRQLRRSERLPFGTPVHVVVGDDAANWGFAYNISLGGLYVRTLTPPPLGTDLTVEFSPPHGRGRVVLEGRVAWRQQYTAGRGYPPGFGLQFVEMPAADGAAVEAGYAALAAEQNDTVVVS